MKSLFINKNGIKHKNGQFTSNLLQCIISVVDYDYVEKRSEMEYNWGLDIGF